MCNVLEFKADQKLIYKRYASLYFCLCVDEEYNEVRCARAIFLNHLLYCLIIFYMADPSCIHINFQLIGLEVIHRYVQLLDEFFGNVCELDIIYGMQNV